MRFHDLRRNLIQFPLYSRSHWILFAGYLATHLFSFLFQNIELYEGYSNLPVDWKSRIYSFMAQKKLLTCRSFSCLLPYFETWYVLRTLGWESKNIGHFSLSKVLQLPSFFYLFLKIYRQSAEPNRNLAALPFFRRTDDWLFLNRVKLEFPGFISEFFPRMWRQMFRELKFLKASIDIFPQAYFLLLKGVALSPTDHRTEKFSPKNSNLWTWGVIKFTDCLILCLTMRIASFVSIRNSCKIIFLLHQASLVWGSCIWGAQIFHLLSLWNALRTSTLKNFGLKRVSTLYETSM